MTVRILEKGVKDCIFAGDVVAFMSVYEEGY
jgi:hypothetical protein